MRDNHRLQAGMNQAQRLTRYKAWANQKTYEFVLTLAPEEVSKSRKSCFPSILATLHHTLIVDEIFRTHVDGRRHGHSSRTSSSPPLLADLWVQTQLMDKWWIEFADNCSNVKLNEAISFEFVDGGTGSMSPLEMVMHLVNHASYHRGYVDDMMYQIPAEPPASDLPVFLHEAAVFM